MGKLIQLILALVVLSVSVITVAANKKHCKKRMAKLKKCFEKGYQPAIFPDCKAGSKAIKKRKTKKCAEIEAKVFENQKCGQFQCESKTNGWTPIFNTTSPRVALFNISEFKVKFTENKRTDKFLYLSVNVNIYDVEGNETGHTNLNLYATKKGDKTIFTGFKRFYIAGPLNDCSRYMTLNYLTDFNFEMTTSVSQSEMFQFTLPNGAVYTEDMMECAYFSDWKEVLKEGVEAAVKLETLIPDLEEYYSTEYMVV
ncbi:hypothetical protein ACHWQZ_G004178 [Mnemiopsis leidyi]